MTRHMVAPTTGTTKSGSSISTRSRPEEPEGLSEQQREPEPGQELDQHGAGR